MYGLAVSNDLRAKRQISIPPTKKKGHTYHHHGLPSFLHPDLLLRDPRLRWDLIGELRGIVARHLGGHYVLLKAGWLARCLSQSRL